MKLNNIIKNIIIIFLIFLLLPIIGCERKYNILIIDIDTALKPTFCLSKGKNCKGGGVDLAFFSIREVDDNANFVKVVWEIFNIGNGGLNIFKYGIVPNGFRESMAAVPLELNKYYLIESFFVFKIVNSNGRIEVITSSPSKIWNE